MFIRALKYTYLFLHIRYSLRLWLFFFINSVSVALSGDHTMMVSGAQSELQNVQTYWLFRMGLHSNGGAAHALFFVKYFWLIHLTHRLTFSFKSVLCLQNKFSVLTSEHCYWNNYCTDWLGFHEHEKQAYCSGRQLSEFKQPSTNAQTTETI